MATTITMGSAAGMLWADDSGADYSDISPVKINSTNFPDSVFRSIISSSTYDKNRDGTLSAEELGSTINIYCEGKGVTSVKGVEYFVNLQGLWCRDNKIKSLDVTNLKDLRGLWCSNNPLTSLDLTQNPELLWVYCYDCNLTALDLTHNPKMAYVEVNTNPITSLDLSQCPELEHLTCGSCELTYLDVSKNPKLSHLDAFRNHLTSLDVTHNPLMKRLDIWDNPGLGSIDVSHCPGLQYYNCAHNDVVNIDVTNNPELIKLNCAYNDIAVLDLTHNPKLCYLDCCCNEISNLDLTYNSRMYFLQAFTNPFTTLNIGNNPFLMQTHEQGVKKNESKVGKCHSWTINFGGDDSTGGDQLYFLCFDDKVTLQKVQTVPIPEKRYPDDDDPVTMDQITRELAIQTLYIMAGSPSVAGLTSRFTDVQPGTWYYDAVVWGEAHSMCTGYPEISSNTFGVGKAVRRQDLCFMLMRYAELVGYKRSIDFGRTDPYIDYFDIDYYAWEAVTWAVTWHIMEGKGAPGAPKEEQRIDPHGKATRSEFEAMLLKLLEVNSDTRTPVYIPPLVLAPGVGIPLPDPKDFPLVGDFVERLYTVALGRASEETGKNYWVMELLKGTKTGGDCGLFFLMSDEFRNRNLSEDDFVEILYKTFFDRASEADGKAYWLGELRSGAKSRDDVIRCFIDSVEWCNVCADFGVKPGAPTAKATRAGQKATDFATRLYTCCLGREPEQGGLAYWSLALTNREQSGYPAAKFFFTSDEFVNMNLPNEEYVRRLYTTFMDREPEADGFAYWVGLLQGGANRDDVLVAFAQCPEFAVICMNYGIERGL
ncbi:MAG: DUF4214 domain-containing protein [Clostridiales bacterium]|nr:DUF4214 domain-containing protein [Clostridiales bacterium]